MTHLERLAVTTMLLSIASAPALAQTGTKWVGGETGMAVLSTLPVGGAEAGVAGVSAAASGVLPACVTEP